MKVLRRGPRGIINATHCNFIIYDEKVVVDEVEKARKRVYARELYVPMGGSRDEFYEGILQTYLKSKKKTDGAAYGHPWLCEFVVYKSSDTTYGFDNEIRYGVEEIKKIITLAGRAKKRCKFA